MREFYAAALPANVWNWVAVWRHNYLAWKKVAFASILGNLADPMIYLFGLGFGFGIMVGRVDGASYIAFLAAGMVATSAMTSATFETIYAAFSRMHVQRMWEAILCTRLTLGDIVLGELAWAATRAFFAGIAVMVVATVLGYAAWSSILYALPAIALTGLAFASLAMILTALAPSHDYFVFYQTLVLTPMVLLSGVIFPISKLPAVFCDVARFLPLAHSVDLIRPAMLGRPVGSVALHIGALCICTVLPFFLSVALLRRRLMS
ncbi:MULTISPECIES: ABC transporter permease [Paraburkholderia]|uniref:Transport permease protein n=2 Tax=Paraburkholderia TaxID=1822464 RepID=A0A1H1KCT0_9BURK|nr:MULTISPECIES: ABC transporter permease [Paraburkholderia]MBB5411163.1 lipooligosaccharide transport system permease protein [Paraburkholderia sp. HC6.4b]MBB5446937.1 lipooligosaccharide transport system permease protein [Paraburkholderia sp. WSM4177]MBB5453935.1 lipooligosaccharide transport system permease protein [Paraburkholderia sp. Kb1A]MBB5487411.1 lipooligosaccharide transport system permease protein [Paraburkholderia sp. WSM4180]MBB5501723.1 lipooligosaccharide transport system perm